LAKILIVEDDRELANFVRSYLEFENHTVEVYHVGGEGRAKLLGAQFNLVILDWEIPEVSGVEMLKEFRDQGGKTPVLMLTGKDQVEDKETGLDCGADDYLTKPFDMKELGARIRALLRRQSQGESKLPAIADVRLDKDSQRALQGGRSVALTQRELQFLEFLIAHPSEPLAATDYMQRVWPEEGDMTADVVKSTIMRLRKKLDPQATFICPHLYSKTGATTGSAARTAGSTLPAADDDERTGMSALNADDDDEEDIDLMIGTVLDGKYEILEVLGGGGTGLVYRAKHRQLQTMVAVKVLISPLALSSENVRRFKREAKTVIGFSHQNILTVHDFGASVDGQPYLVMELITGESLSDFIERRGKIPVSETLEILRQTCDGLQYAHEHGAIHRGIKPSNIMLLAGGGGVKIVDFGLAKKVEQDERTEKLTMTGDVLGSPPYMSPEQCRGFPLDQRTDIYSLGCVMYEMLTGARAFTGTEPIAIIWNQVTQEPPHLVLPEVDGRLRERLDLIVMKCLAKETDRRYQTISDLKADLEQVHAEGGGLSGRARTLMDIVSMEWQKLRRKIVRMFGRMS
jgi:DNA-binding response OmpR family regulator